MTHRTIRITAPHFCAAVVASRRKTGEEVVHECAPILGYMRHWSVERVLKYCTAKGWGYEWQDTDGSWSCRWRGECQ